MVDSPIFVLGYAVIRAPHSLVQSCRLGRDLEPTNEIRKIAQQEAKLAQEALAGKKEKTHLDLVHRLKTSKKPLTQQDILHYFCFMHVIGQPEPQAMFWIPATGNTTKDMRAVIDITDSLKISAQLYTPAKHALEAIQLAKRLRFGYDWTKGTNMPIYCLEILKQQSEKARAILTQELTVCEQSKKRAYARFLEENYVIPLLREFCKSHEIA